jgi:hypothetical protein
MTATIEVQIGSSELEFLASLREYFRGEKVESVLILGGSTLLLATGIGFLAALPQPFVRGLAGVLLVSGAIGGVVGGTIVLRTDRQVAELTRLYEQDRARFAAEEAPRMRKVVRSFRGYRVAYSVAVLAGLGLLLLPSRPVLHGVGVGLLLFAALGFTVDHFAEARAIRYEKQVLAQGTHR